MNRLRKMSLLTELGNDLGLGSTKMPRLRRWAKRRRGGDGGDGTAQHRRKGAGGMANYF